MRGVIVAGTDTGVGKTVCSALLTLALDALYWKPIQCGTDEPTDAETVAAILGSDERIMPEVYRLHAPMSPDQAARREGIEVDEERLALPRCEQALVVETAGGVLVPLNERCLQVDLFPRWELPVVLVARSTLGTLNHTLLTLEALQLRGVSVAGLVLSGPRHEENEATLRRWISVPIIGLLPPLESINRETLVDALQQHWSLREEWMPESLDAMMNRGGV